MAKIKKFKKVIREYELPVKVEPLEEGGYLAYCDEFQGCTAEGETISEALRYLVSVAEVILDLCEEKGLPITLQEKRVISAPRSQPYEYRVPLVA